jgi:hypothetical protein
MIELFEQLREAVRGHEPLALFAIGGAILAVLACILVASGARARGRSRTRDKENAGNSDSGTRQFRDVFVSREHRFAIGIEEASGEHYLSIPVSNRLVDYDEYYRITPDEFSAFLANVATALAFAARAKAREMDDRLMFPPGSDRGAPS